MRLFQFPRWLGLLLVIPSLNWAASVPVILETEEGAIEIEVLIDQAPVSAGGFLAHVDAGLLDDGGFYRTVSPENDNG